MALGIGVSHNGLASVWLRKVGGYEHWEARDRKKETVRLEFGGGHNLNCGRWVVVMLRMTLLPIQCEGTWWAHRRRLCLFSTEIGNG